jgi:hypothetical protein
MSVERAEAVGSQPERKRRLKSVLRYTVDAMAVAAFIFSVYVTYRTSLKPFSVVTWIEPVVQLHHKGNLGVYLDFSFWNDSPRPGLITGLAVVLYRTESAEDKYMLELNSFRVADSTGVYHDSEERLPVFLEPWQWTSRTASFIYEDSQQFPIAMGTYNCELLVWVNHEERSRYRSGRRFDISLDNLSTYAKRRDAGSTTLEPIVTVGATLLKAHKLSKEEYESLVH